VIISILLSNWKVNCKFLRQFYFQIFCVFKFDKKRFSEFQEQILDLSKWPNFLAQRAVSSYSILFRNSLQKLDIMNIIKQKYQIYSQKVISINIILINSPINKSFLMILFNQYMPSSFTTFHISSFNFPSLSKVAYLFINFSIDPN